MPGDFTDIKSFKRFVDKLVKDCQENVKWEIRKLAWIREEQAKLQGITKNDPKDREIW